MLAALIAGERNPRALADLARRNPEQAMRRLARQANALGFTVRFDPIAA
ncbi:hypothetical protein GR925_36480 [Streptomyces sp. HUCO-GS316]|nr:hypothetical protein [Streptomyces sp. HUCO-GS316]MXM68758.1 hypothetical protein [Streptomyces sp. HUCO-GS316]